MQVLCHDLSLALSEIVFCHEEVLAEVSLGNLHKRGETDVLTKDLQQVTYLGVINNDELLDAWEDKIFESLVLSQSLNWISIRLIHGINSFDFGMTITRDCWINRTRLSEYSPSEMRNSFI